MAKEPDGISRASIFFLCKCCTDGYRVIHMTKNVKKMRKYCKYFMKNSRMFTGETGALLLVDCFFRRIRATLQAEKPEETGQSACF
ncbi:MAG: hypothetical protein K2N46_13710 [Lachnospiraceae bacterium]|nr:hypothetical protein [Lachnospiraceae bacterium]